MIYCAFLWFSFDGREITLWLIMRVIISFLAWLRVDRSSSWRQVRMKEISVWSKRTNLLDLFNSTLIWYWYTFILILVAESSYSFVLQFSLRIFIHPIFLTSTNISINSHSSTEQTFCVSLYWDVFTQYSYFILSVKNNWVLWQRWESKA